MGTSAIATAGHNGFSSGFTFSPANPAAGQNVTFSALTIVSNQPVINYLWEFGDGSTGSGASPKHEYARADTHGDPRALQRDGSAFPGQGAGRIVTHTITVS
jgi:PKD repeat protein